MDNVNIRKWTFFDLINSHQITVPIIQRDYVQGRNNDTVNEIRSNFLREILNTLEVKGAYLNLGFVYGKVIDKNYQLVKTRNKESIEGLLGSLKDYAKHLDEDISFSVKWNESTKGDSLSFSKFIPLDGQQRLTTLFLIHWYLLHQMGFKSKYITILKGFKYNTRKKTQEFIEAIINNDFEIVANGKVSSQIKMKTWFLHQWLFDPSVKSMLNTIDSIHELFKDKSLEDLWERLKMGQITFDYLDLEQLQQTDEIYVKMNARGKQLSDFEHFKAWLQGYLKNNVNGIVETEWENKLDGDWLDLFWNENSVNETDHSMLRFFQQFGFAKYVLNSNAEQKRAFYIKIKSTKYEDRFLSIDDNITLLTADELNHVFEVLNFLNSDDVVLYDESISKVMPNNSFKLKNKILIGRNLEALSQNDEIILHGILSYGLRSKENGEEFNPSSFEKWLRIIRNLAANTFIQGYENYVDALNAINEIAKNCFKIEDYFLSQDAKIPFFYREQVDEEITKIEKFKISDNWRFEIEEFENHPYFNGQIGFFFDLLDDEQRDDLNLFKAYGERLSYLFSEDVLNNNYSSLQAALLSYTDYTIKKESKWSFLDKNHNDLRSRFDNWRKIFNKDFKSSSDIKPYEGLKQLVDDEGALNEIIDNAVLEDWRSIFVKNKELIEYCGRNLFSFDAEHNIQLLRKTTFTGKSVDAYLYFLYLMIDKEDIDLKLDLLEINGSKTSSNTSKVIFDLNNYLLELSYITTEEAGLFNITIEDKNVNQSNFKVIERIGELFTICVSDNIFRHEILVAKFVENYYAFCEKMIELLYEIQQIK